MLSKKEKQQNATDDCNVNLSPAFCKWLAKCGSLIRNEYGNEHENGNGNGC